MHVFFFALVRRSLPIVVVVSLFYLFTKDVSAQAGWVRVSPAVGYNMTANNSSIYLATGGEFYRSLDNGATWSQSPQSPQGAITGMHVYFNNILALQEFSGVWKSFNDGVSWAWTSYNGSTAARTTQPAARSGSQTFYTNSCMSGDGSTVFLASKLDQIYRSLDAGITWTITPRTFLAQVKEILV